MISDNRKREYYQALLDKNSEYEGVFFAGIKTTGIFCRPTCSARKPKYINCEFFENAQDALIASYRPCKRCQPLSHPNQVSKLVADLVAEVEENPSKRWQERDFAAISVDVSTARRQFKKRFGMTFIQYARARRMGLAMKEIREGNAVIDAQLSAGFESSSGFRDAFTRIMGAAPIRGNKHFYKASWIDSPFGPMIAIADDDALYLLEFADRRALEKEVERFRQKTKGAVIPGENKILVSIKKELSDYFSGRLTSFKTPIKTLGTPFQERVWQTLKTIPYGETWSYLELAKAIGQPTACRAVARANGTNQLAIIIPCHRVINNNGALGGYGGGIVRKQALLDLERKNV